MALVRIRRVRPDDGPSLVPLFAQWGHPLDAVAVRAQIAAWAATPCAEFLVAEVDGAVVGLAGVSAGPHLARPGRLARLTGLAVDASVRRRGVGAALVAAAEELTTGSRAEAPAFYAALGYEDRSPVQARFTRAL